jgi:hypothetical protein
MWGWAAVFAHHASALLMEVTHETEYRSSRCGARHAPLCSIFIDALLRQKKALSKKGSRTPCEPTLLT